MLYSSKRKSLKAQIELSDGEVVEVIVAEIPTKKQIEIFEYKDRKVYELHEMLVREQLNLNSQELVDRVLEDVYSNSNILSFSDVLSNAIKKELEKK